MSLKVVNKIKATTIMEQYHDAVSAMVRVALILEDIILVILGVEHEVDGDDAMIYVRWFWGDGLAFCVFGVLYWEQGLNRQGGEEWVREGGSCVWKTATLVCVGSSTGHASPPSLALIYPSVLPGQTLSLSVANSFSVFLIRSPVCVLHFYKSNYIAKEIIS